MATLLKLQSNDGLQLEVEREVIFCSQMIKTMIQDLPANDDDDDVIPLPNVCGEILKKVVEWAVHHKDDAPPSEEEEAEKSTDNLSTWDSEFLKVDQATLFELILAANYLDIKGLLDSSCKLVASMIKGKTPQEIRTTFNIRNDFTQSEEEQIRKENEWCEEK